MGQADGRRHLREVARLRLRGCHAPFERQAAIEDTFGELFVLRPMTAARRATYRLEVAADVRLKRWCAGRPFDEDEEDDELRPPRAIIELVTQPPEEPLAHVSATFDEQPIPLMTRSLVGRLEQAGVTTLQCFDTRLVDARGAPADRYLAVNVTRGVSAVAKPPLARLFRFENDCLLVDSRVREALHDCDGIAFTSVRDVAWASR